MPTVRMSGAGNNMAGGDKLETTETSSERFVDMKKIALKHNASKLMREREVHE
ncbi:hypothetical protein KAM622c_55380 (plasmid) [Klebsiella quasipneumoniae subsp. quasipneumoniae]|nr:hypothetical protein KAM622c_55380 [Klebsiella quasipneumoniae subsp. quasipneumoniae]